MDQSQSMQQSTNVIHPQGEEKKEEGREEMFTIPKSEYEKLKKEAAEHLDGWKRAKADYINFKRETEARQAEFTQFAAMSMVVELVPIYDHLQKAVQGVSEEKIKDPWVDGVQKILREFEKFLRGLGVEAMQTEGQPFDPSQHEALGSEKREGVAPDVIIRQVKPGYTLHGKVLIPAQVIVSSDEGLVK